MRGKLEQKILKKINFYDDAKNSLDYKYPRITCFWGFPGGSSGVTLAGLTIDLVVPCT